MRIFVKCWATVEGSKLSRWLDCTGYGWNVSLRPQARSLNGMIYLLRRNELARFVFTQSREIKESSIKQSKEPLFHRSNWLCRIKCQLKHLCYRKDRLWWWSNQCQIERNFFFISIMSCWTQIKVMRNATWLSSWYFVFTIYYNPYLLSSGIARLT